MDDFFLYSNDIPSAYAMKKHLPLAPPVFATEEKSRLARLLYEFVWPLMIVLAAFGCLLTALLPENANRWATIFASVFALGMTTLILNRRGYTRLSTATLLFGLWVIVTLAALTSGGTSAPAISGYLVLVLVAGLFWGGRAGIIMALSCSLTELLLVYLSVAGSLPTTSVHYNVLTSWLSHSMYLSLIVIFQWLASRSISDALQRAQDDLLNKQRAEVALQRSLEQLRALAARLVSIREEERRKVARDIHDELGQALTAIKIDVSSLVRVWPANKAEVSRRAASVLKLVDETIQSVRRISTELRPGILDDLGLVATVEWAGEEFATRTGTICRLDLPEDDLAVDEERATALFRIFQETLTNIARHADATEVAVQLARRDGDLILEVHDNGRGMPEGRTSKGESLGILGMRERTMLFGGDLTITGDPGKGTTVRVRIPEGPRL